MYRAVTESNDSNIIYNKVHDNNISINDDLSLPPSMKSVKKYEYTDIIVAVDYNNMLKLYKYLISSNAKEYEDIKNYGDLRRFISPKYRMYKELIRNYNNVILNLSIKSMNNDEEKEDNVDLINVDGKVVLNYDISTQPLYEFLA